jgi:hypothetical protein
MNRMKKMRKKKEKKKEKKEKKKKRQMKISMINSGKILVKISSSELLRMLQIEIN